MWSGRLRDRRRRSHSPPIAPFADTARFRPDDPDALVAASLACPVCLHGDGVRCEDALDGYDPSVRCDCGTCNTRWRVFLTPEQALRLALMHAPAR